MKTKLRGFTLLELMIVIAVIGIMTTAVVVQINAKQKGQQETQVAARQLEAAVREAQNNALNGIQFAGNNVCGYGVKVTTAGQLLKYHLVDCSSGTKLTNNANADKAEQLQSVTATFANLAAGEEGYVFFTIPFGKLFTNAWTNGSMPNFQLASARDATVITSVCANENLIKEGIGNATTCGAPTAPPPPVCNNNGTCDAGETIANCAADCTPPPPVCSAPYAYSVPRSRCEYSAISACSPNNYDAIQKKCSSVGTIISDPISRTTVSYTIPVTHGGSTYYVSATKVPYSPAISGSDVSVYQIASGSVCANNVSGACAGAVFKGFSPDANNSRFNGAYQGFAQFTPGGWFFRGLDSVYSSFSGPPALGYLFSPAQDKYWLICNNTELLNRYTEKCSHAGTVYVDVPCASGGALDTPNDVCYL